MEALTDDGEFSPPRLATLESALIYGLGLDRGRVFADLWNLNNDHSCPLCYRQRVESLQAMNLRQIVLPAAPCPACH